MKSMQMVTIKMTMEILEMMITHQEHLIRSTINNMLADDRLYIVNNCNLPIAANALIHPDVQVEELSINWKHQPSQLTSSNKRK